MARGFYLLVTKPIRIAVVLIGLQLCLGAAIAATVTDGKAKTTKKPVAPTSATHTHKTSAHGKSAARKSHVRGQAAPSSERTREIQSALIREHYLSGSANGEFDNQTRAALTKYQADHGWQSKVVPDSRALIKLGLGPSREGLLNPDTAAVSPHELGADKPQPGGSGTN
jgi:peptidoglycan hydrolase-like protein with peptidoglycan-binding domain